MYYFTIQCKRQHLPSPGAMSIMNQMALQQRSSHSTFGQESGLGVEKLSTGPADSGYTELYIYPRLQLSSHSWQPYAILSALSFQIPKSKTNIR